MQNPTPSTSADGGAEHNGENHSDGGGGGGGRPDHHPLETLSEGCTDEDGPSPRASIPRGNYNFLDLPLP